MVCRDSYLVIFSVLSHIIFMKLIAATYIVQFGIYVHVKEMMKLVIRILLLVLAMG